MGIKGKLFGGSIGAFIGGPIGAIIGIGIGSMFDTASNASSANNRGENRRFTDDENILVYLAVTFSIAGKLAKSDGQVTRDEVKATEKLMYDLNLNKEQIEYSIRVFNEAKNNNTSVDDYLNQYKNFSDIRTRKSLISFLVALSFADGILDNNELAILKNASKIFNLEDSYLDEVLRSYGWNKAKVDGLKEYYEILGVPNGSSLSEVSAAYRAKVKEYHPDRVSSKGLPDKFIKFAEEEFNRIQGAYEVLKKNLKN